MPRTAARRSELATPASSERCARRRRRPAPTSCSSTSRTPARPSAKEGARAIAVAALTEPGLGPHRAGRPGQRPRHRRGATTTSSRSSPAPATRSTSSSCPRPARPATSGGSTCCSPSSRPSSACTKRIGLEVLIEEAEGLANAAEIARASDRLEAIIFGAGDLSASQHARVDGNFDPVSEYPGDFWHFARVQVRDRGAGRRHRRHRRPVPRLPGPRRLPARGHPRQPARLRRQVGHPPQPDRDRQRGVLPDGRGDRGRQAVDRDLPGGGGRRRRRHRPRRPARRRRPHAPRREHPAQGRRWPRATRPRSRRAGQTDRQPRGPGLRLLVRGALSPSILTERDGIERFSPDRPSLPFWRPITGSGAPQSGARTRRGHVSRQVGERGGRRPCRRRRGGRCR